MNILLMLVLLGASLSAGAQAVTFAGVWTLQSALNGPSGRYSAQTAVDGAGHVLLFGGINDHGALSDTWIWDGTTWKQQFPGNHPPARSNASMANDTAGHVVLFGGFTDSGDLEDTWTWDGGNWIKQSPASSPSARSDAAMASDGAGNILLFGGFHENDALGDTWLWDGSTSVWKQLSPADSPSGRYHATMANQAPGLVVLFGGLNQNNRALNETWIWSRAAGTWTQATPGNSPGARESAAMANDGSGRVVLFGGYPGIGDMDLDDTWTWDGANWIRQRVSPSPAARTVALLAPQAPGQLLLFGGLTRSVLSDMWIYQRSAANFGSVRVGSKDLLTLTYDIHTPVRFGSNIRVLTHGVPNLDFTLTGTPSCVGNQAADTACSVTIAFAPRGGGARNGSLELTDDTGNVLVTTPLMGQGRGAAAPTPTARRPR